MQRYPFNLIYQYFHILYIYVYPICRFRVRLFSFPELVNLND